MAASGSSVALARKVGVREGQRVALVGAPRGWRIGDLPAGAREARRRAPGGAEITIAFFSELATLRRTVPRLVGEVPPDASLWVAWPRRAAGHDSDITDNDVRAALLAHGLVDTKVAALGDDWSGLRFVWRLSRRPSAPSAGRGPVRR